MLETVNAVCLAAAVLSVLLAIVKDSVKKEEEKNAVRTIRCSENARIALLTAIWIIAFAVRIWQFGMIPGGINQDEAMAAVDAKALADYATDRFGMRLPAYLYGWGFGQMSSMLSYLIVPLVKLWGLNVITARLPQLIVSMAGGFFFYLFVKDLFGKNVGLAAAALVAINPWHVMQSRWALDCNLLPHFFVAAMYFFNRGLCAKKRSEKACLYLSMVLFGLSMYCYGITIYTIAPMLLAMAIYYTSKGKIKIRQTLLCAAVYLLVSWPFLLTMAVNFFKWETIRLPFVTIPYFSESYRARDILFFSQNPAAQFMENLQGFLRVAFLQKKDTPWNDVAGFGTTYLCTMPFAAAGLWAFVKQRAGGQKSLAVFMLAAGICAGIFTYNPNVNKLNLIYYSILLFAALGIVFTVQKLPCLLWTNTAIYAVLACMFFHAYFGSYADLMERYFYNGFGDALIQAEKSGAQRIYVTGNTQEKGSYPVSEILTLFYDQTDAAYFQGATDINRGIQQWEYKQRFIYTDITEELAQRAADENAAYVVRAEEADCFEKGRYEVFEYGGYCAVVPKSQ